MIVSDNMSMDGLSLTPDEKLELTQAHRQTRERKDGDRIKAILMLDKGYTQVEIAELLLVEDKSIKRWRDAYIVRPD